MKKQSKSIPMRTRNARLSPKLRAEFNSIVELVHGDLEKVSGGAQQPAPLAATIHDSGMACS